MFIASTCVHGVHIFQPLAWLGSGEIAGTDVDSTSMNLRHPPEQWRETSSIMMTFQFSVRQIHMPLSSSDMPQTKPATRLPRACHVK
jgi:hypothetical protein